MDDMHPQIIDFLKGSGGILMRQRNFDLRSKCDQMRNESWVNLSKYLKDLQRITENGGPETDKDKDIMLLATMVSTQHLTVSHAEDQFFDLPEFSEDVVICKRCLNPIDLCTCDLQKDLKIISENK